MDAQKQTARLPLSLTSPLTRLLTAGSTMTSVIIVLKVASVIRGGLFEKSLESGRQHAVTGGYILDLCLFWVAYWMFRTGGRSSPSHKGV